MDTHFTARRNLVKSNADTLTPGRLYWLLAAVTLVGLCLRLYRIDYQSVWYDEGFALTTSRLPWSAMTERLVSDFVHPPLHYYTLHGWFAIVGFGALESRILSALFGTMAIPAIFALARRAFDAQTAILSATLLAFSQISVMYSQEARPYAQVLFLVTCTIYCFLVAIRERRATAWWAFVVFGTAMVYTHYHSVLVLLSLILYAITRYRTLQLPGSWWIGGAALSMVLYTPWLASGVVDAALNSPKTLPTELPEWFATRWGTIISVIATFNNSRFAGLLDSAPRWALLLGAALFTMPAAWAVRALAVRPADPAAAERRENVLLLVVVFLVPIAITFVAGTLGIQFDVRYVAFCAVPYYVLVALGIATTPLRWVRSGLIVLVILASASALRANYYIPYKENYRDALAYIARQRQMGDCALVLPFEQETLPIWTVYHDGPGLPLTRMDRAIEQPDMCSRLWVLEYRRTPAAIRRVAEQVRALEERYTRVDGQQYFWMHVGLYVAQDRPLDDSSPER